jgi:hypothetical protein
MKEVSQRFIKAGNPTKLIIDLKCLVFFNNILWDLDAVLDQAIDNLYLPVKLQKTLQDFRGLHVYFHMDENILLCLHFKAYLCPL